MFDENSDIDDLVCRADTASLGWNRSFVESPPDAPPPHRCGR
jgi:hypothetical protein